MKKLDEFWSEGKKKKNRVSLDDTQDLERFRLELEARATPAERLELSKVEDLYHVSELELELGKQQADDMLLNVKRLIEKRVAADINWFSEFSKGSISQLYTGRIAKVEMPSDSFQSAKVTLQDKEFFLSLGWIFDQQGRAGVKRLVPGDFFESPAKYLQVGNKLSLYNECILPDASRFTSRFSIKIL